MDLEELSLDESAILLKETHDGPTRKLIVQEIGKRNKAGEKLQNSPVTQEEKSNVLLGVGVLITLVAVAGICVLVLILRRYQLELGLVRIGLDLHDARGHHGLGPSAVNAVHNERIIAGEPRGVGGVLAFFAAKGLLLNGWGGV